MVRAVNMARIMLYTNILYNASDRTHPRGEPGPEGQGEQPHGGGGGPEGRVGDLPETGLRVGQEREAGQGTAAPHAGPAGGEDCGGDDGAGELRAAEARGAAAAAGRNI